MTNGREECARWPVQPVVSCPHCGGPLDLCGLLPAAAPPPAPPLTHAPAGAASEPDRGTPPDRWRVMTARLFPLSRGLEQGGPPGWVGLLVLLIPLLAVALWALVGPCPAPASARPQPTALPSPHAGWSVEQQALLAVVAGYNTADPESAATLRLDPLRPYLDPAGPLYVQRQQALAARQASAQPYHVRLLRWGVGAITVDAAQTTGSVTTQETWEGASTGAAAQTVTVRVVYTLKRATPADRWLIYAAERTDLGVSGSTR